MDKNRVAGSVNQALADLARDHQIVVAHGNGPQVGLLALQRVAYDTGTPWPLDVLGAETEGMIGYLIEQKLMNALPKGSECAILLGRVEMTGAARAFLDGYYADEIEAAKVLFRERVGQNRATTNLRAAARAATFGAVELLLVDIDEVLPGTMDDTDGSVVLAEDPGAASYGVIDEISGRAILAGAKVRAARRADIPDEASLAAVLRYPV